MRRGPALLLILVLVLAAWALYSYWTAGFVHVLVSGTPGQGPWLERVRADRRWLGPARTARLHAGRRRRGHRRADSRDAALRAGGRDLRRVRRRLAVARRQRHRRRDLLRDRPDDRRARAGRARRRIAARTLSDAARDSAACGSSCLLRLNPLTTSDLVSYAAGVAGVPAWKVALGTLVGLAPWCYLQAYFAEQVFEVVPGRVPDRRRHRPHDHPRGRPRLRAPAHRGHSTGTVPGDTQP